MRLKNENNDLKPINTQGSIKIRVPRHIGVIHGGKRRWAVNKGLSGDTESSMFPEELLPFTERKDYGRGGTKVNFLINYGCQ